VSGCRKLPPAMMSSHAEQAVMLSDAASRFYFAFRKYENQYMAAQARALLEPQISP
jgi:hypothetical protein